MISPPNDPPQPAAHRLSAELTDLLALAGGGPLTIRAIEDHLRGRGFAVFIMLLALPFVVPNIPGLSIPFGVAIFLMGVRVALGFKPKLPGFILQREIQYSTLEKIIRSARRWAERMEKVVRPRMHFLQRWPGAKKLIGLGIASGGLFLLLPLPLPLTNTFPAISILLLAAGLMEEDGLLVLWGYFVGAAAWAYLAAWMFLAEKGASGLWNWFHLG